MLLTENKIVQQPMGFSLIFRPECKQISHEDEAISKEIARPRSENGTTMVWGNIVPSSSDLPKNFPQGVILHN